MSLAAQIVTLLLSGGIVAAIASLITSRAVATRTRAQTKGLEAKLPAEVDSVVVQGAEAAVLTMKAALESAQDRITQLQRDREEDRARITELEAKIEDLRNKVNIANTAVAEAQEASTALRRELEAFVTSRDGRR